MLDTVGERLKKARKYAGMTQVDLARAVGAKQGAISDLENGRNHSSTKLVQMAICLDVNAEWLSTGEGEMINKAKNNVSHSKNSNVIMCPIYNPEQIKEVVSNNQVNSRFFEPTIKQVNENNYWLALDDDSMQPTFMTNHLVLINPTLTPEPGDYVIAVDDAEHVLFRKWRDCGFDETTGQNYTQLIAHNSDYPTVDSRFTTFEIYGVATEHRVKLK